MGSVRIGVDISGTLTDVAVLDGDTRQVTIAKAAVDIVTPPEAAGN